jgi:hypothetical protein
VAVNQNRHARERACEEIILPTRHSRERACEEIPLFFVMSAKAGTQASGKVLASLDSRFRGNDDVGGWRGFFHKLESGNPLSEPHGCPLSRA